MKLLRGRLPEVVDASARVLVAGWPRAGGSAGRRPEQGIFFAAIGLPGVEWFSEDGKSFASALRYDLPTLDEAFATAELPPTPPPPGGSSGLGDPASLDPVATALDWAALGRFWRRQDHKLRNARVVDSYLAPFGSAPVTSVDNLIRGLNWLVTVDIADAAADVAAHGATFLPFGSIGITTTAGVIETLRGNQALAGHRQNYRVEEGWLKAQDGGTVHVLGFAPSTFDEAGLQVDNRRSGAGAPTPGPGPWLLRPVQVAGEPYLLATLLEPLVFTIDDQKFGFWCKDVLLPKQETAGTRNAILPGHSLEFGVWDDPRQLAASGREWRFVPRDAEVARPGLLEGLGRFRFFGFEMEPMTLEAMTLNDAGDWSASLQCRLALGPADADAGGSGINRIRVSMTCINNVASVTTQAVDGTLRFALDCADRGGSRRAELVLALPSGQSNVFEPNVESFTLEIAQRPVPIANARLERDGATHDFAIVVDSPAAGPLGPVESGHAAVSVTELKVTFDGITRAAMAALSLRLDVSVTDSTGLETPRPTTLFTSESTGCHLIGMALDGANPEIVEGDGAVTVRVPGGTLVCDAAHFTFTAGLVARAGAVDAKRPGVLPLDIGRFDAALVQKGDAAAAILPGITVRSARVMISASANSRDSSRPRWRGELQVSGLVVAQSAIAWPVLEWAEHALIPVPDALGTQTRNDGRTAVTVPADAPVGAHTVTWAFSGHHLSAADALSIASGSGVTAWTVPVMAWHTLTRGEVELKWCGVESVVIGAPAAIVPPLDGPGGFDADATTFAPRYKHAMTGGSYGKPAQSAAGMSRPGRGALATVLQGSSGAAFRRAFNASQRKERLLVAGGFLGLVLEGDDARPSRPLLRLPVLAGLAPGSLRQMSGTALRFEMAWADGPAARRVAVTRATGPAPANPSAEAVAAAMRGASRPWRDDIAPRGDVVGAALVEQSFLAGEMPHQVASDGAIPHFGPLETTPHFLAAAVSVERALREATNSGAGRWSPALSLVAGFEPHRDQHRPLAGTLRVNGSEPQPSAPASSAQWVVVGQDLGCFAWTGPRSTHDLSGTTLSAIVRSVAVACDIRPLAALLIECGPTEQGTESVNAVKLTPFILRNIDPDPSVVVGKTAAPVFADGGRGPLFLPDGADMARWLASPLEGPGEPVRDDPVGETDSLASGVAGLARRLALPARTGEPFDPRPAADAPTSAGALPSMVWISQTRIPVYLPHGIENLVGPPVDWLSPVSPRVRLPFSPALTRALVSTTPADATPDAADAEMQAFLPAALDAAELGERAGVMTVRRARLLAPLDPAHPAHDADEERFGRPAQAGSSFARSLRTPRPGPLPQNTGNAASDRRLRASWLRPSQPMDSFLGSADTLSGMHSRFGRWSVAVVAAPHLRSIVSDCWDGSLRLACRIDVERNPDPIAPEQMLAALLLSCSHLEAKSCATLKVGAASFTYAALMMLRSASDWENNTAWVTLALDFSASPSSDPTALRIPHAGIAAALAVAGPLPQVELQWTVCPFGDAEATAVQAGVTVVLADEGEGLVPGADRASVTLRLPLYPVTVDRGALPVCPATLIFNDPAYDRILGGVPVTKRLAVQSASATDGRGQLFFSVQADRGQAHRLDALTVMVDLRYERPLDDIEQATADLQGVSPGGDLMQNAVQPTAELRWRVEPRNGVSRWLGLGRRDGSTALSATIPLACVCELPLARLTEADGRPARFVAGDRLVVQASLVVGEINPTFYVWGASGGLTLDAALFAGLSPAVSVMLTDEPTTPPTPALYTALLRTDVTAAPPVRVATALHAQSPLPSRVDLWQPARDFRKGLMRRSASFVWTLMRPPAEFSAPSLAIVKQDRNGQTWLPQTSDDFQQPEELAWPA